jgi:hypothetical protein
MSSLEPDACARPALSNPDLSSAKRSVTMDDQSRSLKGKGCCVPHPALFQRMDQLVISRTDKSLMERFGISYNTWRKLSKGQPVRASLIERLESRVHKLENSTFARSAIWPGSSATENRTI